MTKDKKISTDKDPKKNPKISRSKSGVNQVGRVHQPKGDKKAPDKARKVETSGKKKGL